MSIAQFTDHQQKLVIYNRISPEDRPHPSLQMPPIFEFHTLTHPGDNGGCGFGTNATTMSVPQASSITAEDRVNPAIKHAQRLVNLTEELKERCNDVARYRD